MGSVKYTSTAANGHSKYYHIGIIYYHIGIFYHNIGIIIYIYTVYPLCIICGYNYIYNDMYIIYIIQTHHVEVIRPHLFQEHGIGGMKWRFGDQKGRQRLWFYPINTIICVYIYIIICMYNIWYIFVYIYIYHTHIAFL